jgi:hypothetical protein
MGARGAGWLFLSLLFCVAGNARECCICETFKGIAKERPFYELGCNLWLSRQLGCNKKILRQFEGTTDENLVTYKPLEVPAECEGGRLRLGYVGHWSSTLQSLRYLQNNVIPAMKKYDVDIDIDNTACTSMQVGEVFSKIKNNLGIPRGKTLRFRGNQVTSIGEWQSIDPLVKANVPAVWDSRREGIEYPSCKNFSNQPCIHMQVGSFIRCRHLQTKNVQLLQCRQSSKSRRFWTTPTDTALGWMALKNIQEATLIQAGQSLIK